MNSVHDTAQLMMKIVGIVLEPENLAQLLGKELDDIPVDYFQKLQRAINEDDEINDVFDEFVGQWLNDNPLEKHTQVEGTVTGRTVSPLAEAGLNTILFDYMDWVIEKTDLDIANMDSPGDSIIGDAVLDYVDSHPFVYSAQRGNIEAFLQYVFNSEEYVFVGLVNREPVVQNEVIARSESYLQTLSS